MYLERTCDKLLYIPAWLMWCTVSEELQMPRSSQVDLNELRKLSNPSRMGSLLITSDLEGLIGGMEGTPIYGMGRRELEAAEVSSRRGR